ncbi:MAG: hypothetical protein K1060chlam5_00411 [Candidatus Anoxychlamydiales bacterium]|nr:hypothetical protein [Candidatus Anoxychlamydiales bacterium]
MKKKHLSDFKITHLKFKNLNQFFLEFKKPSFKKLNEFEKIKKINLVLFKLIDKEKTPCFLLYAVMDFIASIKEKKIIQKFSFHTFEVWLNQFSNLNFEKNYEIRGKIAGKYIPRDEYQQMFPIGMGKIYEGSHFVTAHKSPDLDSTISSFWGWLDSFAARVGKNLHFWNVPGGLPTSLIEINLLFKDIFGEEVIKLAKKKPTITLSSRDIMTQEGMILKNHEDKSIDIDRENRLKAVVVVDNDGNYLGDWRSLDSEGVRQIIMLLNNCLRWFENTMHLSLISLFSKKNLNIKDMPKFISKVFKTKIENCEPAQEYSEKQKLYLNDYLEKVIGVKKGLKATFEEFSQTLFNHKVLAFQDFHKIFSILKKSKIFDKKGKIIENRPKIFSYLEDLIKNLTLALQSIRSYIEKLDIALKIKNKVFNYPPHFIYPDSDVEEIKMKLGSRSYLTVNLSHNNKHTPIGIVRSMDLNQRFLGTVSLRDFCNLDEIKLPSYFQVISIIDHHKTKLNTYTPSVTIIGDAQATNTLTAEIAININDKYSMHQMSVKKVKEMLKTKNLKSSVYFRLLNKKNIIERKDNFFIHPQREYIEYLHFLYGILDDTDLLMKVTTRDVEVVAKILNRMKSIALKKDVEIISLNNIKKDKNYSKNAANKILKNKDMYSLYKTVYVYREKEIIKEIKSCISNKPANIFSDVKEQNGCVRISQTKMFEKNIKYYKQKKNLLRKKWIEIATRINREKPELDLHMHMISTIKSASEVFKGLDLKYKHFDELWIWTADTELASEHLKSFLTSFSKSKELENNNLYVEFLGKNSEIFEKAFTESFLDIDKKILNKNLNMAVLYYNAGSINSRKAMISPYLPNIEN